MVDEIVQVGDNRPPVYEEDGFLIIRASAIGSTCLFDLVAAGQGHEPSRLPDKLQWAFQRGHELEPVVIRMLEDRYYVHFLSHQNEGELDVGGNVYVRYHPDGIANLGAGFMLMRADIAKQLLISKMQVRTVVVEIKALSDPLWQKFVKDSMGSVFEEYDWQLSVMMLDKQLPGLWVGYNKGNSDGSYCEDQGKLHFELRLEPPVPFEDIQAKALQIKELVDGEDILTSGQECSDPNHWPCRYLHLRPDMDSEAVSGVELARHDRVTFDNLVAQYTYHKGQEDEHKARRKFAKDELIRLAGGEKGRVVTDKWSVPIYEGAGSGGYDWAAMPDRLKEELKQYKKPGKKYLYITNVQRMD